MLSALLLDFEAPPTVRRTMTIEPTVAGFIYGLLSSGGGSLKVILATVISLLLGYTLKLVTRLPLRLPFAISAVLTGATPWWSREADYGSGVRCYLLSC